MTTGLERAQGVILGAPPGVTPFPASYLSGGKSWCQTFAGNFWEEHFGRNTPNGYPNARAAYNASSIERNADGSLRSPNEAPVGAYVYYRYASDDHVGAVVGHINGRAVIASGTGWSTNNIGHLGKSVYLHYADDYAKHLPFLGWSYTNGARPRIEGLTNGWAPVIAANQRQVKPNADSRIRQGAPSTNAPYSTFHKANAIVTPDGFVRSLIAGGATTDGNDIWFKFGENYSHSSGFTTAGVAGLTDLGTVEPPKPVIKHWVTLHYLNDSDDERVLTVEDGKLLVEPEWPERNGFDFNGWTAGGKFFDFDTPITSDITLQASWSEIPDPDPEPEPGEPADKPDEPGKHGAFGALIGLIVLGLSALVAWLATALGGAQ